MKATKLNLVYLLMVLCSLGCIDYKLHPIQTGEIEAYHCDLNILSSKRVNMLNDERPSNCLQSSGKIF